MFMNNKDLYDDESKNNDDNNNMLNKNFKRQLSIYNLENIHNETKKLNNNSK